MRLKASAEWILMPHSVYSTAISNRLMLSEREMDQSEALSNMTYR